MKTGAHGSICSVVGGATPVCKEQIHMTHCSLMSVVRAVPNCPIDALVVVVDLAGIFGGSCSCRESYIPKVCFLGRKLFAVHNAVSAAALLESELRFVVSVVLACII